MRHYRPNLAAMLLLLVPCSLRAESFAHIEALRGGPLAASIPQLTREAEELKSLTDDIIANPSGRIGSQDLYILQLAGRQVDYENRAYKVECFGRIIFSKARYLTRGDAIRRGNELRSFGRRIVRRDALILVPACCPFLRTTLALDSGHGFRARGVANIRTTVSTRLQTWAWSRAIE